jgi:hypothetical protein
MWFIFFFSCQFSTVAEIKGHTLQHRIYLQAVPGMVQHIWCLCLCLFLFFFFKKKKHLFAGDNIAIVEGPQKQGVERLQMHEAGMEMVPLHGPSLASASQYEDDVYADTAIPYAQYHRGRIAWDEKSSTGFVAMETKLSPSYLTNVLQTLFNNLSFRRFVYAWPYAEWMESKFKDRPDLSVIEKLGRLEDRSVMTHLQRLFARLQLLNERMTKCGAIVRALGLEETRQAFAEIEVQDFLRLLFDQMDSECAGTILEGKLDALVRPLVRTVTCCKVCGTETKSTDHVACWKVPTLFATPQHEQQVIADLETGIHHYLCSTEIEQKCHNCNAPQMAVTRKELAASPELLFLVIDRFFFFPELDRRSKLRNRITFPLTLKLHDFLEAEDLEQYKTDRTHPVQLPDVTYVLSSAVIHNGPSDMGCHYSIIKPPLKEKWYMFADSDVEEVYDLKRALDTAFGKKSFDEDDECAFLLAYVQQRELVAVRPSSIHDVPDYLIVMVREEHANRAERKRRKMLDREMIRIDILYQDQTRDLRVHGSASMQYVTAQAAALFGLDHMLPPTHYRVRKWDKHYKMPSETYGHKLNATVASCRFFSSDMLMVETLRPNQAAFVEYGSDCLSVKVQLYDAQSNTLSAGRIVTLARRSEPLISLKRLLAAEFGIPVNAQRIFKESSGAADSPATVELLGDNEEVSYKLQVWEGTALYLEHSDGGPSDPSACQAEVDRAKNRAVLTYFFENREEKMPIDKRERMYNFKALVAAKEHLDMDRFKVFQLFAADVMTELKNEDQPLHELVPPSHSRDVVRLRIERFVPRIAEKVELTFFLIGAERGKLEALGPSEEWRVESLVSEMKAELIRRIPRLEGKFLRLRELECGGELGNILPEGVALREAVDVLYSNKNIGVEILGKPDPKTNHDLTFVTVLQAHGDWTFSAAAELEIARGTSVDSLYDTVATRLNLDRSVVGLAKATGSVSALDVPQLDWDPKCPNFIREAGVARKTFDTSPFYLRDGDVLIARDSTEAIQDLTDEKKIALMRGILKQK